MKKHAKRRRRFRPNVERLELRLAPLNLMDLGIGALILSDAVMPERSSAALGIDESVEASSATAFVSAQTRTVRFADSQVISQQSEGLSTRNSTERDSAQSKAVSARQLESPGDKKSVASLADDDFFTQLAFYEALTALDGAVNDQTPDHGAIFETGSRPADLRSAVSANSTDLRQTSPRGSDRVQRGDAVQTAGPIGRDAPPQPTVPVNPISLPGMAKRPPALSPRGLSTSPASNPQGGTLQLASPQSEIIVPYQRQEASSSNYFDGEFVVELNTGASSEDLAARHGFTHEFAYSNLDRNLNVWKIDENRQKPNTHQLSTKIPEVQVRSLLRDTTIRNAYPVYHAMVSASSFTNDPLLPAQWHLANNGHTAGTVGVDANVLDAWDSGVTGRGVTIGVVDEGVQSTHLDLGAHFDAVASYDFTGAGDDTPTPDEIGEICGGGSANAECHGTAVAGVAAAVGNNGLGVSGAAPNATIGSLRILANSGGSAGPARAEALAWNTTKADSGGGGYDARLIDVSNNSWGFTAGGVLVASTNEPAAINNGAVLGRGGLGTVYVFAGGNDRTVAEGLSDVNYTTGIHNNRHVIAVAAVGHNGAVASYSNPGAPLLISAPSSDSTLDGITTTDLDDSSGTTNGYHRTDYTENFNGTSSAAPLVSGVVALMLEANPNLTYRDVQHILVESAARDGLSASGWAANQSGREFSHDFGFGLVNAGGAVTLASNWRPVGPELVVNSGRQTVGTTVSDGATVTSSVSITPNIKVESVEVVFNATHTERDDLEVTLEHLTPTTTSQLTKTRTSDTGDNYSNFLLTSRAHWGESSSGTWRLSVRDGQSNGVTGTFDNWSLRIYGTEIVPDTAGPRVARAEVNAKQLLEGKVTGFQVQFNEPITPASFTSTDISLQRVGGSTVTIDSITAVSGTNNTVFDVAFAEQSTAGNYRIDIGPNITDTATNNMNQNGDTTNGEATQDKFTDFLTIGGRYLYSNSTTGSIPTGSLTRSITLPAVNIADLNVLMSVNHVFAGNRITAALRSPGDVGFSDIAKDASPSVATVSGNGYVDSVFDDEASTVFGSGIDHHFTDSYQTTTTALTFFEGSKSTGSWDFRASNTSATAGTFNTFSLIVTPSGMFDISIDSVTNTDGDRDKVEVTYTVKNPAGGNGTAPSFDLIAYDSTDPFFNINSDTKIGTGVTVTNTNCEVVTGCLTGGPHVVEMNASLFPDPAFTRNKELFSLLVADPEHSVLDTDRFNNIGILAGVTLSTDGTLYIAGNPFTANTVTVTSSNVNFNGTDLAHTAATTNDIVFTGGTEVDTFSASGVDENILAFLGLGNDSYTGGNLIDAVQGGAGSDTLNGNNGEDRLYGMNGNDSVDGGAGADTVSVGPGGLALQSQMLSGGTGNDYLLVDGTSKNDRINVWDPDGNTSLIGTSLRAIVSSMEGTAVSGSDINGPDNFGYMARKAAFQNIDLVPGPGVTTVLDGVNNSVDDIDLGSSTFNFYGTSYTGVDKLFVNDNGLIMLGSGVTNSANFDLTSIYFTTARPLISPFFDDLQTDLGGSGATDSTVLAKIENGLLTIEWSNVPHVSNVGTATFQAILELNTGSIPGDITFNYPDIDFGNASFNNGASASVGIQNSNGSSVLAANQLVFDGTGAASSILKDGSAYTFSTDVGFKSAVVQDIDINSVDAGDVLLVNASYGDDWIELTNSAVANSTVGLKAILIGGPGDDTIYDGLGTDSLFGDSGYSTYPGDGVDSLHSTDTTGGDRLIGPDAADGYFSATGFGSYTGSGVGVDDIRIIQDALVDNSHTDTAAVNFYRELKSDGTPDTHWTAGTGTPNYLGGYRVHTTTGPSGGSDHVTSAEWVMTNTGPGWYQFLSTWNASASRAHDAPYTIVDRGSGKVSGAGISTTVFDSDLPQTLDDLYVGATLTFTSGANLGQSRVISDYVGATRRVTLGSALSSVPANTDAFTVSIDRITIAVDQAVAPNDETFGGVGWEKLLVSDGTRNLATSFPILFGTAVVKLSNAGNNVHVIADAVRKQAVAEWFVDNSDTQGASPFEYYSDTGASWTTSAFPAGSYGTSVRVVPVGNGSQTARWTLDKLIPGKYQVFATWTSTPTNPPGSQEDLFRASNVPYKIFDGAAQVGTQAVDQRFLPSNDSAADIDGTGRAWRSLGPYNVASGTLSVEVNNDATPHTSGNPTSVSADAIRVVLLEKNRFDP